VGSSPSRGTAGTAATRAELRRLLGPVVEGAGLDLEDLTVQRAGARQVVRIVVDRDGGVDLDTVAETTSRVNAALDASEADGAAGVPRGAYVLEVSSPGVDRPLALPRHWRRAVGRLVSASRRDGRTLSGRVRAAEDDAAVLEVGGESVRLPYDEVSNATVQVEFTRTEPSGAEEGR
jgi:ribosome maturation factor RimP